MIPYATWISQIATAGERAVEEDNHAGDTWAVINDNPVSLTFRTGAGTPVSAQTVRVDSDNSASDAESTSGVAPRRKLVITGVKGHPTVADTDVKKGYTFLLNGLQYRVVDVLPGIVGEVQAIAEVQQ